MNTIILVLVLTSVTFIISNSIIVYDSEKNIKKINKIIFDKLREEDEKNFATEVFTSKILNKCKEEYISIVNVNCIQNSNKLTIKYANKTIYRMNNVILTMDIKNT